MSTLSPHSAPAAVSAWLKRVVPHIDRELDARLAMDESLAAPARRLREAMRYATLGPGKRLRPALTLAACEGCGAPFHDALAAAASIELLHAYTLVHDDLPAMDDDEMRRGRKTVHVAFDEATAILTGDALLTLSFSCLADLGSRAADALKVLAQRAGAGELLAGQMCDIAQDDELAVSLAGIEAMHAGKTGALFAAAAELGAIAAGAAPSARSALSQYGMALGVAFQFADDADDGDFENHSAELRERRAEYAQRAQAALRSAQIDSALLDEVARWVGGAKA